MENRDFNPNNMAEKLIADCLSFRPNSRCTLSAEEASGSDHVIKVIVFGDGIKWVARLPCPAYKGHGRFAFNWKTRVSSEVATRNFIR